MAVSVIGTIHAIMSVSVATNTLFVLATVIDQMIAIAAFGALLGVVTWAGHSSLCKTVAASTHLQLTQTACRIQEESRTARNTPFRVVFGASSFHSRCTVVASTLVHSADRAGSG